MPPAVIGDPYRTHTINLLFRAPGVLNVTSVAGCARAETRQPAASARRLECRSLRVRVPALLDAFVVVCEAGEGVET